MSRRTDRWVFTLAALVAAYLLGHLAHALLWGAWS